jgi:hypothetical protein
MNGYKFYPVSAFNSYKEFSALHRPPDGHSGIGQLSSSQHLQLDTTYNDKVASLLHNCVILAISNMKALLFISIRNKLIKECHVSSKDAVIKEHP